MDAEQLQGLVDRYLDNREYITNEETTKMALVVPFIRILGYDANSPREVRLEYAAEFTQGDGKRLPDRMDYAIFDSNGTTPRMVIEAKSLGTDLRSKTQQLARYISQMVGLRFGIITDGCRYMFFGDLDNPNQMDKEPFFSFSLDDPKTDWAKVAKFLTKFSKEDFNAGTLATDAENSRYREAMIERLTKTLKSPSEDEEFMKWLTTDLYKGKRTQQVMARFGEIAKEATEPALLRIISADYMDKLKERIASVSGERGVSTKETPPPSSVESVVVDVETDKPKNVVVTTEEELDFFNTIQQLCVKNGINQDDILYKDTVHYFNVSYKKPSRWFVRFFGNGKKKFIQTWLTAEEAAPLVPHLEVASHQGRSKIFLPSTDHWKSLEALVLKSFEQMNSSKNEIIDEDLESSYSLLRTVLWYFAG
jgi:predicted type IV restriction endonuclease